MVAAHLDGRIERSGKLLNIWKYDSKPEWDWLNYDYRVAAEQPESELKLLELWVDVCENGDYDVYDGTGYSVRDTFKKRRRTGVHMLEVVPIKALEEGVWHKISDALKIMLMRVTNTHSVVAIRELDKTELDIPTNEIPALITALQGLMKGDK